MKTIVLLCMLATGVVVRAQTDHALSLWAEAHEQGYLRCTFPDTGSVDSLPFELIGKVSSLEIAAGYTVTFFQHEDLQGTVSMQLSGPCRIDDLEAVPMMTFKGNWDNAIGSLRIATIEKDGGDKEILPAIAVVEQ